ncbi:MAG: M20/M25/M40 family metallo-hydrolase, partial [Rubellimicrobium sp.]|nr:M20/M25/M40 family metallo-hydrolase [Rubellimicrobium sp.]
GRGHRVTDPALTRALAGREALIARLADLIACPSVSVEPGAEAGMEAARTQFEGFLAGAGFANIRRLQGGGHPAIAAEWMGADGTPTLLVYGHYDVQPADPLDQWTTAPFEAAVRDGRIYGRGAADDKGPLLVALSALAAVLAEDGRLPVNIRILIEGEEELGSRTLEQILHLHKAQLACDAVLSADGARWRADLPTLNMATRGIGTLEFSVRTAAKDLHSGRYGGVVPNALHVLSGMLAALHDGDGRITIPGFYEGLADPAPELRAELAAIPFDAADWLAETGAEPIGEAGFTTLERLWLRPCLDVNGVTGGYAGPGSKTVIPAEAHAKLSLRLVHGQDPDRIRQALIEHLHRLSPPCATLSVTADSAWTAATEVPRDHPLLAAARKALLRTTGQNPVLVRIGASLPICDIVRRVLGCDVVMFSFATADENFHAPDEFFRLSAIDEGLAAWIALLRELETGQGLAGQ